MQCNLPVHFASVIYKHFDPVPRAKQSECDAEQVKARSKKSSRREKRRANNLERALAPCRGRFDLGTEQGNVSLKIPNVIT